MSAPKTRNSARSAELVTREQPGYYPGYSTLSQQDYWDETTRNMVNKRVSSVPPIRFFSAEQAALLEAVVNRILPQDDRVPEKRISIVPHIDERLLKNELNGFRFEDMPCDREAYLLGLQAIDAMAQQRFKMSFAKLGTFTQELILKSLHEDKPDPQVTIWKRMPVHRFWSILVEDCVTAYYSHPWAWDEMGFGGPAYPRAYMRLENGLPEPWEVDEIRYVWSAPPDSVSELHLRSKTRVTDSTLLEGTE